MNMHIVTHLNEMHASKLMLSERLVPLRDVYRIKTEKSYMNDTGPEINSRICSQLWLTRRFHVSVPPWHTAIGILLGEANLPST